MPAKWQRIRIDIPEHFTPAQREYIADEIIEHIKTRSESGKDKNGRAFKRYSKSYKESIDFEIAGKTAKVDLTLSGDMLADLSLLSHKKGSILIGYENGTEENARADGNITGSYGRKSGNIKKARDFLGIQPNKLKGIIKKVPDRVSLLGLIREAIARRGEE
jgi:hypothetical protein